MIAFQVLFHDTVAIGRGDMPRCEKRLAERQESNLPDTELLEALKTIRGVGDKVANCICLFSYGRIGAAPIDTWIHKIIVQEYGGVNPFPSYGEYAGILQQFAFYHAISHKGRFADGTGS